MNTTSRPPFVALAAIDLEDDDLGVLDYALELAATTPDAVLHVATVAPVIETLPFTDEGVLGAPAIDTFVERLRTRVQAAVGAFRRRHPPRPPLLDPIQVHCAFGSPASEIVWLAAEVDADLVLVGSHGRKGLRRLVQGSVAEVVMRSCRCPVLVVRTKHHVAPWRVPEIEPICPHCAEARSASGGSELWCAAHAGRHFRAHVPISGHAPPGPSASESITGT